MKSLIVGDKPTVQRLADRLKQADKPFGVPAHPVRADPCHAGQFGG